MARRRGGREWSKDGPKAGSGDGGVYIKLLRLPLTSCGVLLGVSRVPRAAHMGSVSRSRTPRAPCLGLACLRPESKSVEFGIYTLLVNKILAILSMKRLKRLMQSLVTRLHAARSHRAHRHEILVADRPTGGQPAVDRPTGG